MNLLLQRMVMSALASSLILSLANAEGIVTYDRVPNADEIRRQLGSVGGASTSQVKPEYKSEKPKAKVRTRSIVFDSPPETAQAASSKVVAGVEASPTSNTFSSSQNKSDTIESRTSDLAKIAATETESNKTQFNNPIQIGKQAIAFPIKFLVNSSDVLPESFPYLESIANLLKNDPSLHLLVEGHTDSMGDPARNFALSRERALSVVYFLIEKYGINPKHLIPIGKGFTEPLEGLDSANPKNRRVQFRVFG
jgi:outer membrane protein OmpA-like peptidoglycan-associated protein